MTAARGGARVRRLVERAKRTLRPIVRNLAPPREDLPLELWHLSRGASGGLALRGVDLEGLLERFGSPLHVVDAARLAGNAARFTAVPAGAARAAEVFYSYKTNPVPGVLRRLHALGVGAEVASEYELWLALRLGVPAGAIVYNGPAKSPASVREAVERGVGLLNLNSRPEIATVAEAARRAGTRPRVGIRVTVPGGWSGQFGERVETGAALQAFREALARPELQVVALHAHLGGELASAGRLERFVSSLLAFADELRERLGLELEILDVGGSLACPTVARRSARERRMGATFACDVASRDPGGVLSIEQYVGTVLGRVAAHSARAGRPAPRVFLEPGRAMTGNAQLLLCRVMAVRDPEPSGVGWAVLDAGIHVAEAVRGEFHQLYPVRAPREGPGRVYRLAGPTCTPGDVLYAAWRLPELSPGDALAVMDAGAYLVPCSTPFSYPRPGIVAVEGGLAEPLRRAETFEDLVARDLAAEPGRG